jgi:hypothetical protein
MTLKFPILVQQKSRNLPRLHGASVGDSLTAPPSTLSSHLTLGVTSSSFHRQLDEDTISTSSLSSGFITLSCSLDTISLAAHLHPLARPVQLHLPFHGTDTATLPVRSVAFRHLLLASQAELQEYLFVRPHWPALRLRHVVMTDTTAVRSTALRANAFPFFGLPQGI